MLLSDFNVSSSSEVVTLEARLVWEVVERPDFSLFIQIPSEHSHAVQADANTILAPAAVYAYGAGETRVAAEIPLCPLLCENLQAALLLLRAWFPDELGEVPAIQAPKGKAQKPAGGQSNSLLSCGIDSLALLRWNSQHAPGDHPLAIRAVLTGVFADSQVTSRDGLIADHRPLIRSAEAAADSLGLELIPVRTNMYSLGRGYFFDYKGHGAILAALGASLSKRWPTTYIGSSYPIHHQRPWGSHALLDPLFSSGHHRILHAPLTLTRLKKTALVADWKAGLDNLHVCQRDVLENCGTCEKCVRSMLALVALKKLPDCAAFSENDVAASQVEQLVDLDVVRHPSVATWYEELVPSLDALGRNDLSSAIRDLLLAYRERYPHWQRRALGQPVV